MRTKEFPAPDKPPSNICTKRSSAYDGGFEQHLVDNGVYPVGYGGRRNVQKPHNWEEIKAKLALRRP
ncbi:hypothetical protein MMC19_000899, partial [Ptychographa xylographoides]|nr:hypothetical protein [Ptychographa xylographoides]